MGHKILQTVPLLDFFRERVQTAMARQQVAASAFLEFYLVNLLQEFRKTETLFEKQGSRLQEKTLAIILAKAMEGDVHTKIRCLKQLGDVSLYTAGFFGESIRRKIIDVGYYISMGGAAYHCLSGILSHQKTFADLYGELSGRFPDLVGVLNEVATSGENKSNTDLLKLYERWLATGEEHIENLLKSAGISINERDFFGKPQ